MATPLSTAPSLQTNQDWLTKCGFTKTPLVEEGRVIWALKCPFAEKEIHTATVKEQAVRDISIKIAIIVEGGLFCVIKAHVDPKLLDQPIRK